MGKGRYFIAIIPRGRAFEQAEAIKDELKGRFGLKGALRSPTHITLHRPFEWNAEKEEELCRSLAEFRFECPFGIALDGFGSFSQRVIFIDVRSGGALTSLHGELRSFARRRLGLLNEWEDERGFYPHMTIAFRDLRKKNFSEAWSFISTLQIHHDVRVTGFSLLKLEDKWKELRFFDLTEGR